MRPSSGGTPEPLASAAGSAWLRFLGSRAAIVTLLPGLVAAISALLLLVGHDTLRRESVASARARLQELTDSRAWAVRRALGQSDPVLTELRRAVLSEPMTLPEFGARLVSLLDGRPGMAYVSVSYPDGTFRGAYLDERQGLRFQESTPAGRARHFTLADDGSLRFLEEVETDYDPRERTFYRAAAASHERVWVAPYAFYDTRVTGVTRTEAVTEPTDGKLLAVLTVDFDIEALSRFLTDQSLPGAQVMLFTRQGELLAAPRGAFGGDSSARREGRPLRVDDLVDPVLRDFFAQAPKPASSFSHAGRPFMAALSDASDDPMLGWTVAYVAPESLFLAAAERYQRRGLWGFTLVVALALALSIAFAHGVTHSERRARAAEARAHRLGDKARELGSYRLVACLGKGGMGEVWRAAHRMLAREAAIKLIRPDPGARDAEERTVRFRREAEALSQLRCRNTIAIFDYGVASDGTFYYVMELLDGLDLERLVQRDGAQRPGRVIQLLMQVCTSLAEAHDRGLVHRDVKPANLFVCRAAEELDIVKVLDFGLVRVLRHDPIPATQPGHEAPESALAHGTSHARGLLGTPGFMAPEQVMGRDLDGRADLYAVGCVAFWLLTGELLFADPDHTRRTVACLLDVPNLEARLLGVPAPLVSLIGRCLSRKRGGRPADARTLRAELSAIAPTLRPEQRFGPEQLRAFWARSDVTEEAGTRDGETRVLTLASAPIEHEDAG